MGHKLLYELKRRGDRALFERNVYDGYGLYCRERFQAGMYEGFSADSGTYIFVPKLETGRGSLKEKISWAEMLKQNGGIQVAQFVQSVNGRETIPIDGEERMLFYIPEEERTVGHMTETGSSLGMFHKQGSHLGNASDSSTVSFGMRWSQWWEMRIDQLESWYAKVSQQTDFTSFDRWFVLTFPYYLGLTENAIQWLREMESGREYSAKEGGSISHFRFTEGTWLTVDPERTEVKLPSEWLYDHPARDVAEWLREAFFQQEPTQRIESFLHHYLQHNAFTDQDWMMVFGRLVFPYLYIERVEKHYMYESSTVGKEMEWSVEEIWEREGTYLEQLGKLGRNLGRNWPGKIDWILQREGRLR
ncbi:spore coat putative kinase YutH [Thalassorhabdus alkalitolerans]|uniref:Spore coat putative kinase YutH n=1 Tax=Thalassorhabdus alkalitolerans TaxID=2282697 RepID=A0ABW0YHM4_9BACI